MKTVKMIIVWAWVTIPLAWGLMKSIDKSLPLLEGVKPVPAAPVK